MEPYALVAASRKTEQTMKNKPETREEILNAGIEAMTHSIMELIEPCVRQRCKQFVELIENNLAKSSEALTHTPQEAKDGMATD